MRRERGLAALQGERGGRGQPPGGGTSFSNVFDARVTAIKRGMILSQITLVCAAGRIDSLFTTRALEHMGVEPGTEVDVMIKASQIALEARHVD
ncbi:hypothetical protein FO488_06540 [Geobacter sp. FeAm09]|nr:hypothetical protein FO488_06540 [Geobacter sp. FeAm09]